MAGANPMWVAKQLGHATMQMVLTIYSKWIDGADKSQEREKIDAMFASDSRKSATKNRLTSSNYLIGLVGVRGFEPPTPASRTQYSTRLSYTPLRKAGFRPCPKKLKLSRCGKVRQF